MRRALVPLLALVALLVLPAAAPAKVKVAVGIGDQNATMFADANWKKLKLKKTRYFVRWNAIDDPAELAKADRFVSAARQAKVRVLMHISTENLERRKGTLPTVAQYRSKVGKLVRRYKKLGVKDWGVWNEVNHDTQPTYKSPRRAAQFWKEMKKLCKGCTIVALDVLDQVSKKQPSISYDRYIRAWFKAAGRSARTSKKLVIGIHNYSEVNRKFKRSRTKDLIDEARRYNRRAQFWMTETGGLAEFGSLACSESRQANRTSYMFTLAKRYRKYIKRLYSYNWYGTECSTRFDAGLVVSMANPAPRKAYSTFRSRLKQFTR